MYKIHLAVPLKINTFTVNNKQEGAELFSHSMPRFNCRSSGTTKSKLLCLEGPILSWSENQQGSSFTLVFMLSRKACSVWFFIPKPNFVKRWAYPLLQALPLSQGPPIPNAATVPVYLDAASPTIRSVLGWEWHETKPPSCLLHLTTYRTDQTSPLRGNNQIQRSRRQDWI